MENGRAKIAKSSRGFIVLGMHRSGTSCVSNLLNSMGAAFSSEGGDTLANDENPKGFWEHPQLREICNQILQSSGNDWWSVQGFSVESIPALSRQEARQKFANLVSELSPHSPWFIKEPRLCLVLPAVGDQIKAPIAIHVWRDPVEVAVSLARRNGFALDFGVALWERYVRSAFQSAQGIPSVIISYNDLINNPQFEAQRLLDELSNLGASGLTMPDQEVLMDVVDANLHRNAPLCDAKDILSDSQLRLLNALKQKNLKAPEFNQPLSVAARLRLDDAQLHEGARIALQNEVASIRKVELDSRRMENEIRRLNSEIKRAESATKQLDIRRADLERQEASIRDFVSTLKNYQEALQTGIHRTINDIELTAVGRLGQQVAALLRSQTESINAYTSGRTNRLKADIETRLTALETRLVEDEQKSSNMRVTALIKQVRLYLYYRLFRMQPDARSLAKIIQSGIFDKTWYLHENPDVAKQQIDPLIHYIRYGALEGRDPNPKFETCFYLANYPDVANSGLNPLLHYVKFGRAEKRITARSQVTATQEASALKARIAVSSPNPTTARKIVVYTAISGGYDELKVPEILSDQCDFVCFSDCDIPGERGWTIRPFDYLNEDPTRTARYVKTHPHVYFPEYEWSVWVDGNLLIRQDPAQLVDLAMKNNDKFSTFVHPHRDCIYSEANEVISRQLDNAETIRNQVTRYKEVGYPPNFGLAETNVLVRRHNDPQVIDTCNDWWAEIDNGSRRDQLSLNFVANKKRLKLGTLAEKGVSVRNDPRIRKFLHGAEDQYTLPEEVTKQVAAASTPVFEWDRKVGANLVTPNSFGAFDSITVDIIVCVHNSLEDVENCLESVARYLTPTQRIIIVDDGSEHPTKLYCEAFAKRTPNTLLIRRPSGSGYTKAANAGLRESTSDYAILLNSDTIVSRNWTQKLVQAGESAPDIGIIGPMSNAASWQSLPETLDKEGGLAVNDLIPGMTVEHMDQFCELWSQNPLFPRVSLLNGFCFAIKRAVIDTIGTFDEDAFPKGYGEENDFCFRATDAGFALAVATHTYVYHAKSKSYSHETRLELSKEGSAAFRARYSAERIARAVKSTRNNPYLERLRIAARRWWGDDAGLIGAGISALFLLPVMPGGGGVHSVMQEARGLQKLGVRTSVAVPQLYRDDYEKVYPPELFNIVQFYENIDELTADADSFNFVIATAFNSVEQLATVVRAHRSITPAYYIQDYEPFFFEKSATSRNKERFAVATQSYTSVPNLLRFVKTNWLQKTVEEKTGGKTYKIQPSVDRSVYFPSAKDRTIVSPVRITAMVRMSSERRSPEMTLDVLKDVIKRYGKDISVTIFGTNPENKELKKLITGVPVTNLGVLRREAVADLLRNSDVFCDFSEYQAFGRTSLEAMACGSVAIVPQAGGGDEYARHGYNAFVVDTTSKGSCSAAIEQLVSDPDLRLLLAARGMETAERYSIENAALSEVLLFKAVAELGVHQTRERCKKSSPKAVETDISMASQPAIAGVKRRGSALPEEKATSTANKYLEDEMVMAEISAVEISANEKFVENMRKLDTIPTESMLWFLPSFDHIYRGGIRTIFAVMENFTINNDTNHTVVLCGREKAPVPDIEKAAQSVFPKLKAIFVKMADYSSPAELPASDAAFATLWTSAYLLARYNNCKAKFYFIQDFEPSFYPAGTVYGLIEQTYQFGFHGIANTVGVADKYHAYSNWVDYFTPAVDSSYFYPETNPVRDRPYRVVFYGRPRNGRNAFNLGVEALRQVKDYFGHKVEIFSAGGDWPEHRYGLRGVIENVGTLQSMEEVAALYRSCDLGLVFMYSAHPSYQPFEFMASGCATVTNFNPSNTWLFKDRENVFLSGSAPDSVAQTIIDALENDETREKVIEGGFDVVN
ncbi:MAG: glycosyltransferase, partial [Sneathiella sp.]|nr:glycosyltransferase [Sneathiella sp.]